MLADAGCASHRLLRPAGAARYGCRRAQRSGGHAAEMGEAAAGNAASMLAIDLIIRASGTLTGCRWRMGSTVRTGWKTVGRYFRPRVHYEDDRKLPAVGARIRVLCDDRHCRSRASAIWRNMRRSTDPSRSSSISRSTRRIFRFRLGRTTSSDTAAVTTMAGNLLARSAHRRMPRSGHRRCDGFRMSSATSGRHTTIRAHSSCSVQAKSTVPCRGAP